VQSMHADFAELNRRQATARTCEELAGYGIDCLQFLIRSFDDAARMFSGQYEGLPRELRCEGEAITQDLQQVLCDITKLAPQLRQGYIKHRMGAQLLKKAWAVSRRASGAEGAEVARLQLKSAEFFQRGLTVQENQRAESVMGASMALKIRIQSHFLELEAFADSQESRADWWIIAAWGMAAAAVGVAAAILGSAALGGVLKLAVEGLVAEECVALGVFVAGSAACSEAS